MTRVADDLMTLRAAADVEVGRRWRRRGTAIVLLSLLVLAMAVPTITQVATLPISSWVMSYVNYPAGTVPGDSADALSRDDGNEAKVAGWTFFTGATDSYLLIKVGMTTVLDPAPTTSVTARWDAQPLGVATTQTARLEEPVAGWEVGLTGSVVTIVDDHALLAAGTWECTSLAVVGLVGAYCVQTVAISMSSDTPLPESIMLVDAASGARVHDLVLERDSYRFDACQLARCGTFTTIG